MRLPAFGETHRAQSMCVQGTRFRFTILQLGGGRQEVFGRASASNWIWRGIGRRADRQSW